MAVMLVIGAGLLLRTVYNLSKVDAGFDRSRLVTFSISLPAANYQQAARPGGDSTSACSSGFAAWRACRRRRPCRACRRTVR